jgi:fluoroquinolone transport system permease protein
MQGIIIALLIVALSKNKVEGMAVGKFASLLNVGALIPFFVNSKVQFFASIFPSFWIGRAMQRGAYHLFLVSMLISFLWIVFLSKRLMRKIAG